MLNKTEGPSYPPNSILRMYNQFPFRFYNNEKLGISEMTAYIPEIAAMNYNAVWINPLQATGSKIHAHPDGQSEISGSLYAMADDLALNPLIFPVVESANAEALRQQQLKDWTKAVRDQGMFPLFDLVLNHIGLSETGQTALQSRLIEVEKATSLNLLIREAHSRWSDIQGLDYYKDGSTKRGINTEPKDLDEGKIDRLFTELWEPLIKRYILDYGFMGIRTDALTHVPVPVQQRAYSLVKKLVREKYDTEALVVGELMGGSAEPFLSALAACGLTHCMNSYSYFWSPDREGGYDNNSGTSPFCKQNSLLTQMMLSPAKPFQMFKNLVVSHLDLNTSAKLQKETLYIFRRNDSYYFAFNEQETDLCFSHSEIRLLDSPDLLNLLGAHNALCLESKDLGTKFGSQKDGASIDKQEFIALCSKNKTAQSDVLAAIKIKLREGKISQDFPSQTETKGGTVAVLGNHDVGTLRAKVMLDCAYSLALNKPESSLQLAEIYKGFKQVTIKAIRTFSELIEKLQNQFQLSDSDIHTLIIELPLRTREKIFIQTMMSSGGWYSIAGDEYSLCHKPEVFSEYASSAYVGPTLQDTGLHDRKDDIRGFISGINKILATLPKPSSQDKVTMYRSGSLFMVLRYSQETKGYHLIAHSEQRLERAHLLNIIAREFGGLFTTCTLYSIDQAGAVDSFVCSPIGFSEAEKTSIGVMMQNNLWTQREDKTQTDSESTLQVGVHHS